MKLYVVTIATRGEESVEVLGVFDSEQKAEDAIDGYEHSPEDKSLEIVEKELNA